MTALLVCMLLPGAIFCGLAALEDSRGNAPKIVFNHRTIPRPICYLILFVGGPIWLGIFLGEIIHGGKR